MPWHVTHSADCPASKPWAVVKDADGSVAGCHATEADAMKQMAALYAAEPMMSEGDDPSMETQQTSTELPVDNLVRGVFPADMTIRSTNDNTPTVLTGHFAVFDTWTEIKSVFEGNFLERIAPGAFRKTIAENRSQMRVLFQHGRDPQVGDKVLGPIQSLEEDDIGARYEVPLLETSYNQDLLPGLRAGVYGSSFRFKVLREQIDDKPGASDTNPRRLPERTITEARVMEFGPVTFPAYEAATAGIRSLTDDFMFGRYAIGADAWRDNQPDTAPPDAPEAAPSHPSEEVRRDTQPDEEQPETETTNEKGVDVPNTDELRARLTDIKTELDAIAIENTGRTLDADTDARWKALVKEHEELAEAIRQDDERRDYLSKIGDTPAHIETGTGTYVTARAGRDSLPDNIFDLSGYHARANTQDQLIRLYTDGARRALEGFHYPHHAAERDKVNAHIERLLMFDSPDKEIAQRVIVHGSPTYRSAFGKNLMGQPLSAAEQMALTAGHAVEQRALTTTSTGGVTVPIQIDPTVIPTSNGVLNPFRLISRTVQTTSYIWQAVTSPGVTAVYRAEATHMTDGAPTLVAPQIQPERADVFIPFSWEAASDWTGLEAALAEAIQDSKDTLESTKFAVGAGHGSNEPQGVLVGAGTVVGTSGGTAFAVADVYGLENALPPRYQDNATWLASPGIYQRVRQFDTQGGANLWTQLQGPNPPTLIGYPAYKASNVGTAGNALTSSARWGILGDFSRYVIVDRVGLTVRTIPDLFGGTAAVHYPTGQSGLVAYWRNSAGVVDSNAFRVGTIT